MKTTFNRTAVITLLALAVWRAGETRAQNAAPVTLASQDGGILLLAHGGGKEWNANIQAIATEVNKTLPTEVAFGMADRSTLQAGVEKLTARGVKHIIAVPLFVSSHSSIVEATRYLLGLRPDAPPELMDFAMGPHKMDMPDSDGTPAPPTLPVASSVPIQLSAALDHNPLVAEILTDRAIAMSRNPKREVVVLVAHGPNEDKDNTLWTADLRDLAAQVAARKNFARVEFVTLRDDAEPAVRDQATAELRNIVQSAGDSGNRVLIVPVFLSYGGIENSLRQRLDGLDHAMSPNALLPDPRISIWVLQVGRRYSTAK